MKKSIFKRIGLIALAICVAIGSFFVPLTKKQSNNFASADNTTINSVVFNGSDLFIGRPPGAGTNVIDSFSDFSGAVTSYLNYSFRINLSFAGNSFVINPQIRAYSEFYDVYFGNSSSSFVGSGVTFFSNGSIDTPYSFTTFNCHIPSSSTPVYSSFAFISDIYNGNDISYSSDLSPSLSMISVEFGSNDHLSILGYNSSLTGKPLEIYNWILNHCDANYNFICYTDTNNFRYIFFLPVSTPDVFNDYRKYYFPNAFDLDDNQIFNQGYQQGLADNQQNIYNDGYNAGYDVGFGQGRQDGIVEANDYSFASLIGAVVDIPVQTFLGLFEFELLGINLASFFLSLLTVAVIIFIIKLVIGGK